MLGARACATASGCHPNARGLAMRPTDGPACDDASVGAVGTTTATDRPQLPTQVQACDGPLGIGMACDERRPCSIAGIPA